MAHRTRDRRWEGFILFAFSHLKISFINTNLVFLNYHLLVCNCLPVLQKICSSSCLMYDRKYLTFGLFTRLTAALTPWITQGLSVVLTLSLCSHPWLYLSLLRKPSVSLYLSSGAKPNGKYVSELNQKSAESAEVMSETGGVTEKSPQKSTYQWKIWDEISEQSEYLFGRVDWCPRWCFKFLTHSSADLAEPTYKVLRGPGSIEVMRTLKGFVPDLHMGIWSEIEEVISVKTFPKYWQHLPGLVSAMLHFA